MSLADLAGTVPEAECPRRRWHTKSPNGYLQWSAWAEKKSVTHDQVRCEGCGLYVIWVRRKSK